MGRYCQKERQVLLLIECYELFWSSDEEKIQIWAHLHLSLFFAFDFNTNNLSYSIVLKAQKKTVRYVQRVS